jgi:hypothetical protein
VSAAVFELAAGVVCLPPPPCNPPTASVASPPPSNCCLAMLWHTVAEANQRRSAT